MMTTIERQRLAAILGMLGSDHAGERDAAARQAEAFRRKHQLTWAELLAMPPIEAAPPPPEPKPPPPSEPEASAPPPPNSYDAVATAAWSHWHWLGLILVPWAFLPWITVRETIRLVRRVRLYGFARWVRDRALLNVFTVACTIAVVVPVPVLRPRLIIVTLTYRYRRPARKKKPALLECRPAGGRRPGADQGGVAGV